MAHETNIEKTGPGVNGTRLCVSCRAFNITLEFRLPFLFLPVDLLILIPQLVTKQKESPLWLDLWLLLVFALSSPFHMVHCALFRTSCCFGSWRVTCRTCFGKFGSRPLLRHRFPPLFWNKTFDIRCSHWQWPHKRSGLEERSVCYSGQELSYLQGGDVPRRATVDNRGDTQIRMVIVWGLWFRFIATELFADFH